MFECAYHKTGWKKSLHLVYMFSAVYIFVSEWLGTEPVLGTNRKVHALRSFSAVSTTSHSVLPRTTLSRIYNEIFVRRVPWMSSVLGGTNEYDAAPRILCVTRGSRILVGWRHWKSFCRLSRTQQPHKQATWRWVYCLYWGKWIVVLHKYFMSGQYGNEK